MTNIKIQKEIELIKEKIVQNYQPEKIIIFGSYVWGKPNKSSDLDLFIIKNSRKERRFRTTEVEQLLLDRQFPLDILVYTPKETADSLKKDDFFVKEIINQGEIIYDRKSQMAKTS
ncbi:MAG: DNA polymerase subunit beta [uncultured bacterium]|nr:MAG: DNA polymerase subunit beta [uncultured bacterium]